MIHFHATVSLRRCRFISLGCFCYLSVSAAAGSRCVGVSTCVTVGIYRFVNIYIYIWYRPAGPPPPPPMVMVPSPSPPPVGGGRIYSPIEPCDDHGGREGEGGPLAAKINTIIRRFNLRLVTICNFNHHSFFHRLILYRDSGRIR